MDDVAIVHLNVGFLDDRLNAVGRYTWGLGTEIAVSPRLWAIAEAYDQKGEKASAQVGLRYWIAKDKLQVDGTFGSQHDEPQNRSWVSIGVRILF